MSSEPYPPGVSTGKFSPDGKVLPFRGNTIVSHLPHDSPLYRSLLSLHSALSESPLRHLYTLLPPESWHMTLFEGVCDKVRVPTNWPVAYVPLDAPLEQATDAMFARLRKVRLTNDERPPYRMRINGMDPLEVGVGIHLEAADREEDKRIRRLRDRLADVLELRMPGHEGYGFHFSIAYLLRELSDEQERGVRELVLGCLEGVEKEFDLGAPEVCTFEDMFAFKRELYLGEGK